MSVTIALPLTPYLDFSRDVHSVLDQSDVVLGLQNAVQRLVNDVHALNQDRVLQLQLRKNLYILVCLLAICVFSLLLFICVMFRELQMMRRAIDSRTSFAYDLADRMRDFNLLLDKLKL